jgi:DNA-binding NtrC family response regulator
MEKIQLTSNDRAFLSLVSEAAFANPFSKRRAQLDQEILGKGKGAGTSGPGIIPEVERRVSQRIEALEEKGGRRIQDFCEADRKIVENTYLFDIFHAYSKPFDDLIRTQIAQAQHSVSVTFASQALADLTQRGFTRELANRGFSLFFQIRRAYHFIHRGLLGESACMQSLREHLWNHIFTSDIQLYEQCLWNRMEDFSTILLGPTGSGKGAAAAAIGRSGYIPFDEKRQTFAKDFTKTFIPVNLSQYAETLLESELFGHTKGAFTGAVTSHDGMLSLCGIHGSIFLDEIGDISPAVQVKLLKVLEERTFSPVGSHTTVTFQGRVIAATHRCLDTLRQEGQFRDDFYYRLCSDCIEVPSLQQRIGEHPKELDGLIDHTVCVILGCKNKAVSQTVRQVIDQQLGPHYHWPGNVRELAQCVRRVIIKRDYQGDRRDVTSDSAAGLAEQMKQGTLRAEELLAHYCKMLYERFGTYEEVARRSDLDRRTVKRYVLLAKGD